MGLLRLSPYCRLGTFLTSSYNLVWILAYRAPCTLSVNHIFFLLLILPKPQVAACFINLGRCGDRKHGLWDQPLIYARTLYQPLGPEGGRGRFFLRIGCKHTRTVMLWSCFERKYFHNGEYRVQATMANHELLAGRMSKSGLDRWLHESKDMGLMARAKGTSPQRDLFCMRSRRDKNARSYSLERSRTQSRGTIQGSGGKDARASGPCMNPFPQMVEFLM